MEKEMLFLRSEYLDPAQKLGRFFSCTHRLTRIGAMAEERHGGRVPDSIYSYLIRRWANSTLKLAGIDVEVIGREHLFPEPSLFLGNHVSYLDIPLIMAQKPVSFVAKKEIEYWPFVGYGGRKTRVIFVRRSSSGSRRAASEQIANAILMEKLNVCIFPSGTTAVDEKKSWKWGAFKIAQEYDIPVQPFRVSYTPLRRAAYIDDDFFPTHFMSLMKSGGAKATLEFHPPVRITDVEKDCLRWWRWSQGLLGSQAFDS